MLLDDVWWGVGDFNCLNQDIWLLSEVEVQDVKIYRMLLDYFWWGFGDFFCLIAKRGVAISGCPGCEDFQDVTG